MTGFGIGVRDSDIYDTVCAICPESADEKVSAIALGAGGEETCSFLGNRHGGHGRAVGDRSDRGARIRHDEHQNVRARLRIEPTHADRPGVARAVHRRHREVVVRCEVADVGRAEDARKAVVVRDRTRRTVTGGSKIRAELPEIEFTLLLSRYALDYYLPDQKGKSVVEVVRAWREGVTVWRTETPATCRNARG